MRQDSSISTLAWLRQYPGSPNPKHLLEHIERLEAIKALLLPSGIEHKVHRNRLLKLAREGGQMTAQHLRDLETTRRYATLVAVILEAKATIIDEIIDMHDRMIGAMFNKAKRSHEQQFSQAGKAINEKVQLYWKIGNALMEARDTGMDPFAAIERIIPWNAFEESVTVQNNYSNPMILITSTGSVTDIARYAAMRLLSWKHCK